jgi:hypothetical protein
MFYAANGSRIARGHSRVRSFCRASGARFKSATQPRVICTSRSQPPVGPVHLLARNRRARWRRAAR